ncbi:LysR substrate-binding domain-containing protein [Rhodococcoides kyotonense]|uniref:DNA-binding transcriptional regulator, LysR family n=1 Tax=Rhodococcoides kyotonense TaxID=398843 RepID=A0A239NF21_9NOCA|nr:LysR substrate-binding domain-containing protein [Rhodococcus kyotonensis]SNT52898.1 DNA-binding transcriptional regulator, LysR family [Rhodococcus kyotonensis]
MDAEQLRAFLAVAEELHFGRTAARLHIAQPPLSRTIKRLERHLGATLFDRNTRSVQLTTSGRALIEPARAVIDALRSAENAVASAGEGETGLVKVAFAGVSTHSLVARLARTVRAEHPGIELELSSQNFAQPALKKVLGGETDIALGRWDLIPSGIGSEVVMVDHLVLAVADTHALARAHEIGIDSLAAERFVSLPPHEGSVLPDRLHRFSVAHGFVADVVQVAPDTQTALALVAAEVGCHLTLASVADNVTDPHVAFVSLSDMDANVDLRVAWREDSTNPALRVVLRQLMAVRST